MRLLLSLVLLFCSSICFGSGELVLGGYYLDDVDQSVSPKVGLATHGSDLGVDWSDSFYVGMGYLNPANAMGVSPWYEEVKADLFYHGFMPGLVVGVGAGLIANRQVYASLDDHVHVSVAYKLW